VTDRPGQIVEVSRGRGRPGPGDVVMGKYRLERMLGAGSMGVVFAAQHLQLGIEVAIKWPTEAMAANAEAVTRFEREARAAARIRSEHVVRVIDVGSLDDGTPLIVMERLRGEDLAARLARSGQLSVPDAADYVLQACKGVGEAHALGIVHRDLKPENLFCAEGPDGACCVKVLDFGISKISSMSMTQADSIVGSPHYMSPEQMASPRDVDPRTDVWALGVVLHELIAGSVPFPGDTFPEVCLRVVQSPPASSLNGRPDVPPGLPAVILRCLEKERSKRFVGVADFAAALAPFAERRTEASGARTLVSARTPPRRGPARWRPKLLVGVGSSAALALVSGILLVAPAHSAAFAESDLPRSSIRAGATESQARVGPAGAPGAAGAAEACAERLVECSLATQPGSASELDASPAAQPVAPRPAAASTLGPLPPSRAPAAGASRPSRPKASLYDYRK
jgi:eukaryotic-like serine/threonine-protein kinase